MCLVAWPLNESETGVDLVLIEPSLLFFFSYANDAVLMLISMNLHDKSSEVSIKTRSTPASLSFNGQATKHTTVKWSAHIFAMPIWSQNLPKLSYLELYPFGMSDKMTGRLFNRDVIHFI